MRVCVQLLRVLLLSWLIEFLGNTHHMRAYDISTARFGADPSLLLADVFSVSAEYSDPNLCFLRGLN